ncbi:transposase [Streptomyces sp. NPDC054901]
MPLTDAELARIEPILPDRAPRRGGLWRDHRLVIDAITFKYRTGTPWMDLSEPFGSWKVAHNRLRTWAVDGTWAKGPHSARAGRRRRPPCDLGQRRTMAAADPPSFLARTSLGPAAEGVPGSGTPVRWRSPAGW